jgi:hypothetical protein
MGADRNEVFPGAGKAVSPPPVHPEPVEGPRGRKRLRQAQPERFDEEAFDRLRPNGKWGSTGTRCSQARDGPRLLHPFTLSLSKGPEQKGFDKLSLNGSTK